MTESRKLALDANRRLATALGWTNIFDVGNALLGKPNWVCDNSRDQVKIPNWAGDWNDCGPLIGQYMIGTEQTAATSRATMQSSGVRIKVGGDVSRDDATRRAIVTVLANRLEFEQRKSDR